MNNEIKAAITAAKLPEGFRVFEEPYGKVSIKQEGRLGGWTFGLPGYNTPEENAELIRGEFRRYVKVEGLEDLAGGWNEA
jgi:hypothetical protein